MATFTDASGGVVCTVRFGAQGYSDYTIHRDKARRERYIARHAAREDWNNPCSAGALSRWILWNKETVDASLKDFAQRFNISLEQ